MTQRRYCRNPKCRERLVDLFHLCPCCRWAYGHGARLAFVLGIVVTLAAKVLLWVLG